MRAPYQAIPIHVAVVTREVDVTGGPIYHLTILHLSITPNYLTGMTIHPTDRDLMPIFKTSVRTIIGFIYLLKTPVWKTKSMLHFFLMAAIIAGYLMKIILNAIIF